MFMKQKKSFCKNRECNKCYSEHGVQSKWTSELIIKNLWRLESARKDKYNNIKQHIFLKIVVIIK